MHQFRVHACSNHGAPYMIHSPGHGGIIRGRMISARLDVSFGWSHPLRMVETPLGCFIVKACLLSRTYIYRLSMPLRQPGDCDDNPGERINPAPGGTDLHYFLSLADAFRFTRISKSRRSTISRVRVSAALMWRVSQSGPVHMVRCRLKRTPSLE